MYGKRTLFHLVTSIHVIISFNLPNGEKKMYDLLLLIRGTEYTSLS